MAFETVSSKLIASFIIISLGFFLSKIAEKIILYFYRRKHGASLEKPNVAKITVYLLNILAILTALSFLQINFNFNTFIGFYSYAPTILSTILLFIVVILIVQFIFFIIKQFLRRAGVIGLVNEYGKENLLEIFLDILKLLLYVTFTLIALQIAHVDISSITYFLSYVLYPVLLLGLLFIFIGLKSSVANLFSGFFLKYFRFFRKGEYVQIDNKLMKITEINTQGLVANVVDGVYYFAPYKELFDKGFYFKKIVTKIDTLEKIKEKYVAQSSSYCGPASASMILKIFGYNFSQEEIGKMAGTIVRKDENMTAGTKPEDIIKAVKELTKEKVLGAWINSEKIYSLKEELKSWLNDGALVIVDYKKSVLFPSAKRAHYSVCLEVEGEELLLLDPSSKSGGVYYADYKRVYSGMDTFSELLQGKRGYMIFAPDGSAAYQRIKDGLIYFEPDFYDVMNKELKEKLSKIKQKSAHINVILPEKVKKFLEEESKKEKISRIWKPSEKK